MTDDQPADVATQLKQVSCASLVDAMGRLYDHRAHLLPLVSPDPTRPLFGPAATITFLPARADLDDHPDFADLAPVLVEARRIEAEDETFAEHIRAEHPSAPHRGGI